MQVIFFIVSRETQGHLSQTKIEKSKSEIPLIGPEIKIETNLYRYSKPKKKFVFKPY